MDTEHWHRVVYFMTYFIGTRENARYYKAAARAATTANITLSGAQTIDAVPVVAGDRVLVKDQSTGSQNGLYVCASGAWSRASDADQDAEVRAGLLCYVSEGTANGNKFHFLSTDDPIVVGTTALTFSTISGGGGGSPGGSTTELQYNNAGSFGGVTGFTYDSTTKALAYAPASPTGDVVTITGGTLTTTKKALAVTATLAASTSEEVGESHIITTSSGARASYGIDALFTGAGAAGTTNTVAALRAINAATGNASNQSWGANGSNQGINGGAQGAGTAHNVGFYGDARASTTQNAGAWGSAVVATAGANIGSVGLARNTSGVQVGAIARISTSLATPTLVSSALFASNGDTTDPIFVGRDDDTTRFLIADGGSVTITGATNTRVLSVLASPVASGEYVEIALGEAVTNYQSALFRYINGDGVASASKLRIFNSGDGGTNDGLTIAAATGGAGTGCFIGVNKGSPVAALDISNSTGTNSIFVANDNTTAVFTIADGGPTTISPNGTLATTKNALAITATLSNPGSTSEHGSYLTITAAGSSSSQQRAFRSDLTGAFTGSGVTSGGTFVNSVAGALATIPLNISGNFGGEGHATATTTGHNAGQFGYAIGGSINMGVFGFGDNGAVDNKMAVGVWGQGRTTVGGTGRVQIGGYFAIGTPVNAPSLTSTALIADNRGTTSPIFVAMDNTVAVFTIADGGAATSTSTITATDFLASSLGLDRSSAGALAIGSTNATSQTFGVGGVTLMTLGATTADRVSIAGGTLTTAKNALKVTGTTSTTNAAQTGVYFDITPGTSSGSSASQYAVYGLLEAGYTGTAETVGVRCGNIANGTGTTPIGSGNFGGNYGASGIVANSTAGHNVGALGYAQGSSVVNYGVAGSARSSSATAANYGVVGSAVNDGGGHRIGGYFFINSAAAQEPTASRSVGLVASNGNLAANIFEARDGPSTAVFTLTDGMTAVSFGTGFDRDASGTYAIGGTNITTLNLGRSGQTQALLGNATVAGTLGVAGLTAATGGVEVAAAGPVSYKATSPAQITANQNNYSLGTGVFVRLDSDASRDITGFSGGSDGRMVILANVGSNDIVIKYDDSNSTAANRIYTNVGPSGTGDLTLTADDTATFIYDSTTQRWRCTATQPAKT